MAEVYSIEVVNGPYKDCEGVDAFKVMATDDEMNMVRQIIIPVHIAKVVFRRSWNE